MKSRIHTTGPDPNKTSAVDSLPLLLLAALPLLLWLFDGSLMALIAALVHFALLGVAALLIAQGHAAHQAYDAAPVAHRPAVPRKLIGALLLGVLVFLLAASRFTHALPALMLGLAAAGFAIAAFGFDPLRHKGLNDPAHIARSRADALIVHSDAALRDAVDRVGALGHQPLTARTEAMHGATMRLLRAFAVEPERLLGLQKPLDRFLGLVEAEVSRLEAGWQENPAQATRLYATRLTAMTTAFEAGARQRRQRETPDAYALDADLLVERMQRERAA
ncbi:hypothetical protein ROJ8625_03584 [Roseivivax jejudonensis]|uniref:5-bromo-4-chloroindolyl phosphate hydrolysis protein n=1 Tax=Roseivivax jejudonensis TaxID=1529041 RepID=A0A1X7A2S4_9RHOB|nr:hypothetical protein [Roseivivax jejudonensis]SLN68857.1 hypothetical protein ROJ8625_03584 [Roseivivax jejudonensis]